jgi:glycosyltransferase involved in cell wall biosynthesis
LTDPLRLTLLTEIPAPYRIPIFNALAGRDDVELEVVFLRDRDPKRPYRADPAAFRFRARTLPGLHVVRGSHWLIANAGVFGALVRTRPDAIVAGGWLQPAFWQALAFAKLRRRPLLAWVESTARDARGGSRRVESAKRLFVEAADGFLVPGSASRDYVASLGADPARIAIAPNAADLDLFATETARADRDTLRARLGLTGTTFLCVGRLAPEKGVDLLLRALADVPGVTLAVAGVGPEEAALRALAERSAPGRVRFLGFVAPARLVEWYAAADAFVLPSRSEQWSIPLNEAAAAGLPLVATDAAGAAHDLVADGVNGFLVPAGDVRALAGALERIAADEELRQRSRAESLRRAAAFTPAAWADAVAGLAHRVVR